MLRRALEREEAPAQAGMREDLAEKLRQVDAQLKAQLHAGGGEDGRTEQAGHTGRGEAGHMGRGEVGREGRGGPEEANPSATTPACTAPPCTAAESVAAAAEVTAAEAAEAAAAAEVAAAAAASTAASAPSEASGELAPVPLRRLLALSDDLLLVCTAHAPHVHRACGLQQILRKLVSPSP